MMWLAISYALFVAVAGAVSLVYRKARPQLARAMSVGLTRLRTADEYNSGSESWWKRLAASPVTRPTALKPPR
jgi:hypothetical protein